MRAWISVGLLLLAVPLAGGKAVSLQFEVRDDGFRVAGVDGVNPLVAVEAGSDVTIRVRNEATAPHNLVVGAPVSKATACCLRPGDSATLAFRVDENASGEIAYWSEGAPQLARGAFRVGPPLPIVRILSPAEGADVGGLVEIRIEVEDFVLEPFPAGTEPVQGRGHVRYLLDGGNASVLTDETAHVFERVPVGHHILTAELVGRDGAPLDPPASDDVLVYRRPDATPVPTTPGEPEPTATSRDSPGPALALLVVAALIASRCRHPR